MASNSLLVHNNSSLGCWDLHTLGVLNADISSSYHMEHINAASLILSNSSDYYNCNYSNNHLSSGYLEDALIEFSVRFKRRRLMVSPNDYYGDYNQHDPFTNHHFDDLNWWSNWLTNYNIPSQNQALSHASLYAHHDTHYSLGENMDKRPTEKIVNLQERDTFLLDEAIKSSPKLLESSSFSKHNCSNTKKFTNFAYNSDTNSNDYSSSISVVTTDDKENRKKNKVISTKMVYPFGLVKPGGEEGDITLKDINKRIFLPPTRPLKHPVGDFACRPAVSPHGPGLSGKAVVALTKIHTQGRGTITIIRTKG